MAADHEPVWVILYGAKTMEKLKRYEIDRLGEHYEHREGDYCLSSDVANVESSYNFIASGMKAMLEKNRRLEEENAKLRADLRTVSEGLDTIIKRRVLNNIKAAEALEIVRKAKAVIFRVLAEGEVKP